MLKASHLEHSVHVEDPIESTKYARKAHLDPLIKIYLDFVIYF